MTHRPKPGPWLLTATSGEAAVSARPSVLVIDDDAMVRQVIGQTLQEAGYAVELVEGGRNAFERLASNQHQVVVLDLVMPELHGLDVLRFAAEMKLDAKVVVLSGDARFQTAKDALLAGAFDFVSKPYRIEALLDVVARALAAYEELVANRRLRERIEHSDATLRFVVHSSPDLVFVVDRSGHCVFVNERFRTLLGYDPNSLIGKPFRDLVIESDHLECERILAGEVSNHRDRVENARHGEIRVRHAETANQAQSGRSISLELSTALIYHDDRREADHYLGLLVVGRDVTERRRTLQVVQRRAYVDELTQLPNRGLFEDRLSLSVTQARRNADRLAVLFLDLDRFKAVNDFHGHYVGDRLLRAAATRLRACIRRGDTLARYGGDEFTILLPNVRSAEDVEVLAHKIHDELTRPFKIEGLDLTLGVSIGIALFPEAGLDGGALVQSADLAMYQVKAGKKGGYRFYNEEIGRRFNTRLTLDRELRGAVDLNQFEAHYLPSFAMANGELEGFEALLRWRHPSDGLLMPEAFLASADAAGVALKIDEWIQREAFCAAARWRQLALPDLTVSVNVTAAQLEHTRFAQRLLDQIEAAGIPASAVVIDVTESAIARDVDLAQRALPELRAAGVRIAIDDFGTGLFSLAYLQGLPVDILKIDGSILRARRDDQARLFAAVAGFGRALDLAIAAEGIETARQLDLVRALKLNSVQGFLLGMPESAQEVTARLSKSDIQQSRRSPLLQA